MKKEGPLAKENKRVWFDLSDSLRKKERGKKKIKIVERENKKSLEREKTWGPRFVAFCSDRLSMFFNGGECRKHGNHQNPKPFFNF